MGVLEDIRNEYPTLAWLINHPEVGPLLRKAVDPASQYSPGRFQAELMQTSWFRGRTQSQREAEILRHTDPKTYGSNLLQYRVAIRNRASQLGVQLTSNEVNYLATVMYSNGQDMEGPLLDAGLLRIRKKPGRASWGSVRSSSIMAKDLAEGQYYLSMGKTSAYKWGEYLATGQRTEQELRAYLGEMAISKYPWLKNQIRMGHSVDDIFSEHKAAIARTLEFDPEQINLTDGKWRKVIEYMDHKSKKRRMMTVGEAEYLARQDPRYWNTKEGKAQDAGATSMVLRLLGKRPF